MKCDDGDTEELSLVTLYDAAFRAVAELESTEFWTADQSLFKTAYIMSMSTLHLEVLRKSCATAE